MAKPTFEQHPTPSYLETEHQIGTLVRFYSDKLSLGSDKLHSLLKTSLTEQLGTEQYFKPSALPYLYKSLQLEGKLSSDPDTLRNQLQNTWLIIVDVANLKAINELKNSSHEVGDSVINLSTRSIQEIPLTNNSSQCLIRFMGDEFAIFHNNPDRPSDPESVQKLIDQKTNELIKNAQEDPNDPLHYLATHHKNLIGKVVQFAQLQNIQIPDNIRRADDMVEVMFAAAEKSSPHNGSASQLSFSKSVHARVKNLDIPAVNEPTTTPTKPAIDMIANTITNLDHLPSDELINKNDQRMRVIENFVPSSLARIWNQLKLDTQDNMIARTQILNFFDEALFNSQFGRNPPILNEWVFNELTRDRPDLTHLSMYSSLFTKLFNLLEGRLTGTSLLKSLAGVLTSTYSDQQTEPPSVIIKKQGASFYMLTTKEFDQSIREKILSYNKLTESAIDSATDLKETLRASINLITQSPNVVVLGQDRSATELGEKYDELRQGQYQEELDHLVQLASKYDKQSFYTILLLFLSERADRYHTISSDPEKWNDIFGDHIYTDIAEFFTTMIGPPHS